MGNNVCGTCAKSTTGTERSCERANDHVDLRGIDVLGFGQTTAGSPKNSEGPGLVEHKAELVAEFKLDLEVSDHNSTEARSTHELRKIHAIAYVLEQALCNNKASSKRLPRLLLDNFLQHPLQIFHVVMLVISDRAPANL